KHARMHAELVAFLCGTYYRWAQLYPIVAADTGDAPRVLAVWDLHVGSFGTWRDGEGRLAWGVDDFDNAYPLPYTNDLVRLAASAAIARDAGLIAIKPGRSWASKRSSRHVTSGSDCANGRRCAIHRGQRPRRSTR